MIGDFNNDGFDDVAVGASTAANGTSSDTPPSAGQTYVVYGKDFPGTGVNGRSVSATTAGDVLLGSKGVDVLDSAGHGGVVQRGGAGNDVLRVNGHEFSVNAGGGLDVLTPDANGIALDFNILTDKGTYKNIEQVQLNGFGTNTLDVDIRDVLSMSGAPHELLVTGDAAVDTVSSPGQGWTQAGTVARSVDIDNGGGTANLNFNVYHVVGSSATLLVQNDLNQALIT